MSGVLYLVGLGPGSREHLTFRAGEVLAASEAVVGYGPYVDRVAAWFPSDARRYVRGELGREPERAAEAVRLARQGLRVALVSSGDAALYGMAGPLFELLAAQGWDAECPDPSVEVVPGVTAALAANALLGAPLADDVALVSLSDVLAPWPLIAARVEAAARADFVLALYNPASTRRRAGIHRAQQILLRHRPPSTPVALVRNALREGTSVALTTLEQLLEPEPPIDMATLVVVGNRRTSRLGNRLVSRRVPRGTGAAPIRPVGKVWLVGAGPGDPGLITARGLELLRAADAVVHDRLVPLALLDEAPGCAERYDVGKTTRGQSGRQAEINALLVRLAREGQRVVRLKGGDAFVFGRGGEEAAALAAAGVPWEVVPGVSAAVAAPAYAGIPLTHRGLATSFAVTTGHQGIVDARVVHADTLVILMAVEHLAEVVASALAQGRPADTPAALVHAATTPEQRTIVATLGTIVEAARRAGIPPPSTLVLGPTVRLAACLAWCDGRDVSGERARDA